MSTAAARGTSRPWNKRLGQPWHSAILALVGVFCAFIAFGHWRATDSFLAASVTAKGTVVSELRDGSSIYPVVAFQDAAGHEHRLQAHTSPAINPLQQQQTVRVRYIAAMPEQARIDSFWELWMDTAVSLLLAAAFLAGALFLWTMREAIYSLEEGAGTPDASPA